ncbi:MAG: RidA family protein [Lentilactobacillus hilgardii]|jgi:2-iminobutanoate/2-iminopropanoate deaminase|uniref:RidA family protein n=1 Tax=Lentilactobacillus hilgardii TaxID=1588 RepID=A0A6P1E9T3_LENHI|nr:RidA family protein [Lentilactobacillus hilgardii]MCI2018145.1 RidA family protein [Lentilactobacillus buchneri]RRG08037.1 MAG: RidA family protein [Lactobacillus sp.]EEI72247.1 putative endoribonuclease L-PSP [Lentilactobacillus hilgardii ATCC 27305]MBZ2201018.1 RidA family protein [Lentilactobacillus hilgardii]MBZ2203931.1 RidA family protein [Lentilactobacillus hilgardii]
MIKMAKEVATKNAPNAVGPYSQAVQVGNTLYCSGQIGLDPATGKLVSANVVDQTTQALHNLQEVVKTAGFKLDDVVKVTVFMANVADFSEINKIYDQFFGNAKVLPARSAVGIAGLPLGAQVEIEAIASKS